MIRWTVSPAQTAWHAVITAMLFREEPLATVATAATPSSPLDSVATVAVATNF
jgi:hypothetical protein